MSVICTFAHSACLLLRLGVHRPGTYIGCWALGLAWLLHTPRPTPAAASDGRRAPRARCKKPSSLSWCRTHGQIVRVFTLSSSRTVRSANVALTRCRTEPGLTMAQLQRRRPRSGADLCRGAFKSLALVGFGKAPTVTRCMYSDGQRNALSLWQLVRLLPVWALHNY
jgi:hypothetical protein